LLTNCHTLILRRLLGHGPEPLASERDLYLYNVAPDSLPLSKEFTPGETHRFEPPPGALARFPKLLWVKCHLVVDNFCHYGSITKSPGVLAPGEKQGYTYRRGLDLVPLVEAFAGEMDIALDPPTAHYLAHILVEIAVDYAIYAHDRTVPVTLRTAQEKMSPDERREYHASLAALYGCGEEKIERARGAPARFYGSAHDIDYLYLTGRTKIILRKLRLDYGEANTDRTQRLILDAAERTADFMDFVDAAVEVLADRDAWGGEAALDSGTG